MQFVALFHVYRDHQKDADLHIVQFVALLHVYRGDQIYVDLQMKLTYFERIKPSVEKDC